MTTAVEILRAPETRRRILLPVVTPPVKATNFLIPHPTTVLGQAVAARRLGQSCLRLEEDDAAYTLRQVLEDPDALLLQKDLDSMAQWVAGQKEAFARFRAAVRAGHVRDLRLHISESWLDDKGLRRMLITYRPDLTLNRREVRLLFDTSPVWAAFGFQVGVSIEAVNRPGKAAGGPDFLQMPYLGLVNEFVTDDHDFLNAAKRVAELLHQRLGYVVKATLAKDFFMTLGYPHPERP